MVCNLTFFQKPSRSNFSYEKQFQQIENNPWTLENRAGVLIALWVELFTSAITRLLKQIVPKIHVSFSCAFLPQIPVDLRFQYSFARNALPLRLFKSRVRHMQ